MFNYIAKKWKSMGILKKVFTIILILLLVLIISNCKLVSYGIQQGVGQIRIVRQARPISEMLADQSVSDSLKAKFKLVDEIKKFAVDSLGLNPSKNYNSFYDQHGNPILWVTTGSFPYKIEAYTWKFPVVGTLPYKGFFDRKDAVEEAKKLEAKGFDTRIGEVSAWSTLGFFKDPILSEMLDQSEGQIARLIIHELTHSTLYVKSNARFSENLATFIGDEGAKFYLERKYGIHSPEYKTYIGENEDMDKFASHILRGAKKLDSLYLSFEPDFTDSVRNTEKFGMIQKIVNQLDTIHFFEQIKFKRLQNPKSLPNNAFFMGYITYNQEQGELWEDFKNKFNSDFKSYLNYLKSKYEAI